MRVHDSQEYRKMDVTRERVSRMLELREILMSFRTGFNLVNAAVVCAILESTSGLEPSSVITEPGYLKLVTVSLRYADKSREGDSSCQVESAIKVELLKVLSFVSAIGENNRSFTNCIDICLSSSFLSFFYYFLIHLKQNDV